MRKGAAFRTQISLTRSRSPLSPTDKLLLSLSFSVLSVFLPLSCNLCCWQRFAKTMRFTKKQRASSEQSGISLPTDAWVVVAQLLGPFGISSACAASKELRRACIAMLKEGSFSVCSWHRIDGWVGPLSETLNVFMSRVVCAAIPVEASRALVDSVNAQCSNLRKLMIQDFRDIAGPTCFDSTLRELDVIRSSIQFALDEPGIERFPELTHLTLGKLFTTCLGLQNLLKDCTKLEVLTLMNSRNSTPLEFFAPPINLKRLVLVDVRVGRGFVNAMARVGVQCSFEVAC